MTAQDLYDASFKGFEDGSWKWGWSGAELLVALPCFGSV